MPLSASSYSRVICDRLRAVADPHAAHYVIASTAYTVAWRTKELRRLADRMERHDDLTGACMLRAQADALAGMFDTSLATLERLAALDAEDAAYEAQEVAA